MQIQKTTVFNFSFKSGGINYNFSIAATNQDEAIEKLRIGLTEVLSDLTNEQARLIDKRVQTELNSLKV
jgi:hypothetical protein